MPITPLAPEDWQEPRCLLCATPGGTSPASTLSLPRIIQRYDLLMESRAFDRAREHLLYWLKEAELQGDRRSMFSLSNELMGHFRMTGQREAALESARQALALLEELELQNTISAATCYINCATVYVAFDLPDQALPLFEKARELYETHLPCQDPRLGGLYNNMGLACVAAGEPERAMALYEQALGVMENAPHGALEQAMTLLNMADAEVARRGPEAAEDAVNALLEKAAALLDTPSLARDGYYAWVCEKCAPVFRYYGWFITADELEKRMRICHERA